MKSNGYIVSKSLKRLRGSMTKAQWKLMVEAEKEFNQRDPKYYVMK